MAWVIFFIFIAGYLRFSFNGEIFERGEKEKSTGLDIKNFWNLENKKNNRKICDFLVMAKKNGNFKIKLIFLKITKHNLTPKLSLSLNNFTNSNRCSFMFIFSLLNFQAIFGFKFNQAYITNWRCVSIEREKSTKPELFKFVFGLIFACDLMKFVIQCCQNVLWVRLLN